METQFINLNMTPMGITPCFHVSQYDIGRPLGFIVYNGSEVVDLDSYTCTIEATRSDGVAITASVATDDNVGTFETTATMTNKADKYKAQLVIVDENSKRVASLPFDMEVTKAAMDENSEAIEEDASLYQQYTETVQGAIAEANEDIQAEENARIAAVNAEATARANADTTLQNNINAEASARASADSNLQSQINQIIAPSGEAPSAAEVENARIGADGRVYETLGDAIRTQNSNLKSALSEYNDAIFVCNNLVDGLSITNGKYYSSGYGDTDDNASLCIRPPIILLPNKTYTMYHINAQYSFLRNGDAQGTRINQLGSYIHNADGSHTYTTPNSSSVILLYPTSYIVDSSTSILIKGDSIPADFENGKVLIPTLKRDTDDFIEQIESSISVVQNYLVNTNYTEGGYYSSGYGDIASRAGYGTFAPTILKSNTYYTLRIEEGYDTLTWLRNGDAVGQRITTLDSYVNNHDGTYTFKTPNTTNTVIIYVTSSNDTKNSVYLGESKYIPSDLPRDEGGIYIDGLITKESRIVDSLKDMFPEIGYAVVNIAVSKSYTSSDEGWGITKFSSIISAVNSISDSNKNKRYVVTVQAGTDNTPIVYDEWNSVYAGHAPASESYVGLIVPRYVTITTTDPEYPNRTVLYMDGHSGISDTMTYEDAYKKCLFHLSGKCFDTKIQGFTLRAKDCRYAFHAESNVDAYGMTWYLDNCIIDWLGCDYTSETGWSGHAVGLGIGYGGKGVISNCKWINKQASGNGITGHTNGWNPMVPALPTMPGAELEIINCDLGGYSVSLGNAVDGNELNNIIKFHNVINCQNNTSSGWDEILEATHFTNRN